MNNVIALLIKLLLFTDILAVYQLCMCIYFNDNIVFLSIFFDCKPYFIYVLIICCLHCDSFHIHMKLYFDWIYGK